MRFKKLSTLMLTGVMSLSLVLPAYADTAFGDVNETHWAYDSITWAAKEGVVKGDDAGNFRPNVNITEAEFLAMLFRTFETEPEPTDDMKHWADPLYWVAVQHNWPIKGYSNYTERSKALNRTRVAEIISAADGVNFSGDDAIRYMLKKGYSNGITSATVEGYQGSKSITRAEAVTLIKNLLNKGMTYLQVRPEEKTPSSQVSDVDNQVNEETQKVGNNLNAETQKVVDAANKFIAGKKEFADVKISAPENDMIGLMATDVTKHYYPTKIAMYLTSRHDLRGIRLTEANNEIYLELVGVMLKAAGVPVDANFTKTLIKYRDSQEEAKVSYGEYTVKFVPDNSDINVMSIFY